MNKSKRIKSIDFFRGLCITWMIFGHLSEWWMTNSTFSFVNLSGFFTIIDFLGAAGLLFISGMSITISYRKKLNLSQHSEDFNFKKYRTEYIIRALLLFLIGIMYNLFESIKVEDASKIWIWFILQTLPICLLIAWPILKLNKYFKLLIGIIFLAVNEVLTYYLLQYEDQYETMGGIFFYILYNGINLSPILQFFSFFIFGSFIGDVIHEKISLIKDGYHIHTLFLKKITLPLLGMGLCLLITSTIFLPNNPFQDYYFPRNFSWILYSIGGLACLYTIILTIEKLEMIKIKSKYRFFYYFSFYSFTAFLIHLPLYYLFEKKLDLLSFLIIIPITIFLFGIFLRILHMKLNTYISIKAQLSRVSSYLADFLLKKKS
ncbi:MAG: DUF1624 domain-containing protein [Candidatus Lokiarchaeota archaeon]|nr:DUF1624 domain-containing protein [Candidatus Lokiarchaeota archaeon]